MQLHIRCQITQKVINTFVVVPKAVALLLNLDICLLEQVNERISTILKGPLFYSKIGFYLDCLNNKVLYLDW